MKPQTPDILYAEPRSQVADFVFDAAVADVFTDMINRSVPGYQTMLGLLAVISAKYAQPNTDIYDLGCSLGGATLILNQHVRASNCKIIAVDNAPAMINKCRQNLSHHLKNTPVEMICANIIDLLISNASLAVMNLTLQFIDTPLRLPLLKKIHTGLVKGGALFISEKIKMPDDKAQATATELHHAFKKANGYSELEVAQKRTALENVLIPETLETHIERLRNAGFSEIYPCFSCLNFAALLAIK
ncbi:MAG: carboxy-S-adenosyl-L-methionine synthase CmoA [Thiothrix sp.]|nr:MAG: carboxy-S-adenosyl-L-methionine synthase CmoA [Thiothrix sp.]